MPQQMHTSQRSVFGRPPPPCRSKPWGNLSLQRVPSPGSLPGRTFAQPSPPHHAPQTTPASHDTMSAIIGQEYVLWLSRLSSSLLRKHCWKAWLKKAHVFQAAKRADACLPAADPPRHSSELGLTPCKSIAPAAHPRDHLILGNNLHAQESLLEYHHMRCTHFGRQQLYVHCTSCTLWRVFRESHAVVSVA